jgi:hypothetical protein
MLTTRVVNEILYKLDMSDSDFDLETNDVSGDFLEVRFPETKFSKFKVQSVTLKPFKESILDIGHDFIVFVYKFLYKGYTVLCNCKILSIDKGSTKLFLNTKRIDYVSPDGNLMSFVTFEMFKEYLGSFEIEE